MSTSSDKPLEKAPLHLPRHSTTTSRRQHVAKNPSGRSIRDYAFDATGG